MESKLLKVVMLPTKDLQVGTVLLRHLWEGDDKLECRSLWQYKNSVVINSVEQYTTLNGSFRDICSSFKPQHLYFTSDEKIIEGDWCYNHLNNAVIQWMSNKNTIRVDKGVVLKESCSKVIATTNCSLNRVVEGFKGEVIEEFLPKIPQDFIEEYCKQGGIDSVEVEYVKYAEVLNGTSLTPHDLLRLNRTQDNHVVIKPARQYSRDEVEQLLHKCQQDMHAWFSTKSECDEFNEWIKNNL